MRDAQAAEWVARIRDACPGVWLAHAPFALPLSHADFPYRGLGACDAVLPQLYPHEFGGGSADLWHARYRDEWARCGHDTTPRAAIIDTYGREVSASAQPFSLAIFARMIELVEGQCERWPSLYSIEAMHPQAYQYLTAQHTLRVRPTT